MADTARDISDGLYARWCHFIVPPAVREEFKRSIASALTAYGDARAAAAFERGRRAGLSEATDEVD